MEGLSVPPTPMYPKSAPSSGRCRDLAAKMRRWPNRRGSDSRRPSGGGAVQSCATDFVFVLYILLLLTNERLWEKIPESLRWTLSQKTMGV